MSDAVCRMLRTKSEQPLLVGDSLLPWTSGESTSAAYWCLGTSDPAGPDGRLAHPHLCVSGRECWRPRGAQR